MPSYSSRQFVSEWRYSLAKDFHSISSSDPTQVRFAPGAPQIWGSEVVKLEFSNPNSMAINCDETLLAIGVENSIHIFKTDDWSEYQILRGHPMAVESIAFHPTRPLELTSSAQSRYSPAGETKQEPEILFWNLDEYRTRGFLNDELLGSVCEHAVKSMERHLETAGSFSVFRSQEEREEVSNAIRKVVSEIDIKHSVEGTRRLVGRMISSSKTTPFNADGSKFMFMPGEYPHSNGRDERWKIMVWDPEESEELFVLAGHTDAIMWMGFSPDGKTIGTVCWDQTYRLWDSADGKERFVFKTNQQNWAGAFSPDSTRFAATCGDSNIYICDVNDGSTLSTHKFGTRWCRALDWSPDAKYLAVGGANFAKVILLEVGTNEVVQERKLNGDKAVCEEVLRPSLGGFLEVSTVHFMTVSGKTLRLAYLTGGEGALEVVDFDKNEKWRFVAPDGNPTSRAYEMVAFRKRSRFALLDGDGARIWDIPESS